ncbi:MAG: hypothetical protein IH986_18985 [Planctomycetes bacterium]|nr:hypothetical protein [Planctomycetota bacterium]
MSYRRIPRQALSQPARPEVGWEVQRSGVSASLRGLCAVSRNVAWASGTGGIFVRTDDRGRNWRSGIVPGAESLDFRDVHAFDERTAILLSAGQPARVYKTNDGGETWRVTYQSESAGAFFDALAFWDPEHGIAFSDPVDGAFLIITTNDGGETWTRIPPPQLPEPLPGEAGFAAGGTCLAVQGSHNVWIGTGGATVARVLRSSDRGRTWTVAPTPVRSGKASSGIFSLVFRDSKNGVIVGGDYREPEQTQRVAAWTDDGGATWSLVEQAPPGGYRSCVALVPNMPSPTLVAVGPNGSDLSVDGGRAWQRIGSEGYHSVSFAPDGAGWAVGAEGRVARFVRAER